MALVSWIVTAAASLALLFASFAASARPPDPPGAVSGYKAVLIAGDQSAQVFDHATETMRGRLLARGVAPEDIQRLSAAPAVIAGGEADLAGLAQVFRAIGGLRPGEGQGCFVFVTSHGGYRLGLLLEPRDEFLTPAVLDRALVRGCGDAPTVAIVSGCYSGSFVRPPMSRANRIILTASREDRNSFGCGDDFDYTVYDRCVLTAMDRTATWREAYRLIAACVAARERALGFRASEPKAWFGAAVAGLPIGGPR